MLRMWFGHQELMPGAIYSGPERNLQIYWSPIYDNRHWLRVLNKDTDQTVYHVQNISGNRSQIIVPFQGWSDGNYLVQIGPMSMSPDYVSAAKLHPLEEFAFTLGEKQAEQKRKWCHCILEVEEQKMLGGKAKDPYSICSKSVGTSSRECGRYYDWQHLTDGELRAYAKLHQLQIPEPYDRERMLQVIRHAKAMEFNPEYRNISK